MRSVLKTRVYDAIARVGPATPEQICAEVPDIPPSTVYGIMTSLKNDGMVTKGGPKSKSLPRIWEVRR